MERCLDGSVTSTGAVGAFEMRSRVGGGQVAIRGFVDNGVIKIRHGVHPDASETCEWRALTAAEQTILIAVISNAKVPVEAGSCSMK